MNVVNYQKVLDQTIDALVSQGTVPRLLLHSCCAPCSSYCIEYLSRYFEITVFYYNPNIFPEAEYRLRAGEQRRLIEQMPAGHPVRFMEGAYEPDRFFEMAEGLESAPEGGERCLKCYALRLEATAAAARAGDFDYFTTTLTISPLKNAAAINEIGGRIGKKYGVSYLYSDFKKKNGYKRSVELSAEYGLYRQNYCGCVYSRKESVSEAG